MYLNRFIIVIFSRAVYKEMAEAMNKHPDADVLINFASLRSAYDATLEAMQFPQVSSETTRTLYLKLDLFNEFERKTRFIRNFLASNFDSAIFLGRTKVTSTDDEAKRSENYLNTRIFSMSGKSKLKSCLKLA